jgi:hypothetical protein
VVIVKDPLDPIAPGKFRLRIIIYITVVIGLLLVLVIEKCSIT